MFSFTGSAKLIYSNGKTADIDCRLAEFEVTPGGLKDWSGSGTAERAAQLGRGSSPAAEW